MSLSRFIFPRLTRGFFIRIAVLAVSTWLVGMFWLRPMVVDGESMEPTYAAHGFNVCVLTAYRSRPPARGDVVVLKYGGTRYMLVEQDDCHGEDPIECLRRSWQYLRSRGFE
jgi:hypothetical protein